MHCLHVVPRSKAGKLAAAGGLLAVYVLWALDGVSKELQLDPKFWVFASKGLARDGDIAPPPHPLPNPHTRGDVYPYAEECGAYLNALGAQAQALGMPLLRENAQRYLEIRDKNARRGRVIPAPSYDASTA